MFERNRVDNARQMHAIEVELTLDDGRALIGRIAAPTSLSFIDVLNSDDKFMDFTTFDGGQTFLAKSSIKSIRRLNIPKARPLQAVNGSPSQFDPHTILGVDHDTNAEALRQAFLQKSKTYHPDRYSHVELPDEVRDYLQASARRVNMAYETLQAALPAVKAVQAEPIWQSQRPADAG